MKMGKKSLSSIMLGYWINQNHGKAFAVATPEGVWTYRATFTSRKESNEIEAKQDKLKQMFIFDEAHAEGKV